MKIKEQLAAFFRREKAWVRGGGGRGREGGRNTILVHKYDFRPYLHTVIVVF